MVLGPIVTFSPEGTAGECEIQGSCRPSGTAWDVYAVFHGLQTLGSGTFIASVVHGE